MSFFTAFTDFLSVLFHKRRTLTFWPVLLFLSLLLIPEFAYALGIFDDWKNDIIRGLVNLWVSVIVFVPALLFFIVSNLATWLIEASINIPITPGSVPPAPVFVTEGWKFTRAFANIFFVLILVFIGLATILRLQTYQFQKTFIGFVAIVLLVNFSAVLVGFVVDMANIVASVFVTAIGNIGDDVFVNIFTQGTQLVNANVLNNTKLDLVSQLVQGLVLGISLALFYIFASLIYGLVFLLFLLRTIILWILVITAPLAFAAYILPVTRRLWSQWWGALIQWSFFVVPLLFFIYLSLVVMNIGATDPIKSGTQILFASQPPPASDPANIPIIPSMTKLLVALLSPFTGLVMLFIGLIISISFMPRSAQVIAGVGTAAFAYAKFKAKKTGKELVQRGVRSTVSGQWTGKQLERFAGAETTLGRFGKTKFGKWVTKPVLIAQRGMAKQGLKQRAGISNRIDEQMRDKDLQAFVGAKDWKGLAAQYNNPLITPEKKIAIATLLAQQEGQTGLNRLGAKNKNEAIDLAAARSPGKHLRDLIRDDPSIAARKDVWSNTQIVDPNDATDRSQMESIRTDQGITRSLDEITDAGPDDEDYEKIAKRLSMRKSVRRLTPQRIGEMTREGFLDNSDDAKLFQEEFVLNKNVQSWGSVQDAFGEEAVERLRETALRLNEDGTLEKQNSGLIAASTSNSQLSHLLPTFVSRHDIDGKDTKEAIEKYEENGGKAEDYVAAGSELTTRAQVKKYNEYVTGQRRRERQTPEQTRLEDVELEAKQLPDKIRGLDKEIDDLKTEIAEDERKLADLDDNIRIAVTNINTRVAGGTPNTDPSIRKQRRELGSKGRQRTALSNDINQKKNTELPNIQKTITDDRQHLLDVIGTHRPIVRGAIQLEETEKTRRAELISTPAELPEFSQKEKLQNSAVRKMIKNGNAQLKELKKDTKQLNKIYKEIKVYEDQLIRSKQEKDQYETRLAGLAALGTLTPAQTRNQASLTTEKARVDSVISATETTVAGYDPDRLHQESVVAAGKTSLKNTRDDLNEYREALRVEKAEKEEKKRIKKEFEKIDEETKG